MNQKELANIQATFSEYLLGHLPNGNPANLYDAMQYLFRLGGKRTRPMLCILSCASAGGNIENAYPLALVAELFHNFSLVHDDIMDNADLRRNEPTVHRKWNVATAILAGDNLLVETYHILNQLNAHKKTEIIDLYNRTAREVCEGQQMDMDFAEKDDVAVADYLEMIRMKTAVLLGFCSAGGALLANADTDRAQLYYDFALNLGIAFQLMDDYLDTFGNSDQTGKAVGGDIAEKKKTWLFIASKNISDQIIKIFETEDVSTRIKSARDLFISQKLNEELLAVSDIYHQKAMHALDQLDKLGDHTEGLQALARSLALRTN